ncbi:hypothetical protein [Nostocoides veronense]|uniref:Acetyltransferase n=1 Tax=Nostocoides veronense TaxID=330836 RepID=A0ABP4Y611_9MICO
MDVHTFIAFCEDDNPASIPILEKAGLLAADVTWTSDQGWVERKYSRQIRGTDATSLE